ncbi:MAG: ATP-binding protein [Thermoproteota archaeon]|nr:ATP-binding protein [Thermoproteota archaeon]
MQKLEDTRFSLRSRTIRAIITAAIVTALVTIDLLATRQVIPVDSFSEPVIFILTVVIGYGIGSWVLFAYTSQITKEIRQKSPLIKWMHLSMWSVQFFLAFLLILVIYTSNTSVLTPSIYTISSLSATCILTIMSVKFFMWYSSKKESKIILVFALTSAILALSIAVDAGAKLVLVQIAEETSPEGIPPKSSFLYQLGKDGKILYKDVQEEVTKIYYLPNSSIDLYHYLNLIPITISFLLRWLGCTLLLRHHYQAKSGLTAMIWIILLLPLILYLVGKVPDMLDLPSDYPYRFYFRILFRIGSIGGSVLFGLAFFVVARTIMSGKVKDYLATTAMGITLVGVSLSTSALQQTYGVAGHSLVLLASYLFGIGLYCSGVSVVHDYRIRQVIRNSTFDLLKGISAAEIEQKIRTRVLKAAMNHSDHMIKDTGIAPSITEDLMKDYMHKVFKETGVLEDFDEIIKKEREILNNSSEYSLCSKYGLLELAYSSYFDSFEKVMDKSRKARHEGIRCVTYIDQENIGIVKKFIELGVRIKHVKNLPPIDFAFSDNEMIATIEKAKGGKLIKNLLVSNEPLYIEHFRLFFEELWTSGVDSGIRIKSIEEGLDSEGIEIIQEPQRVQGIAIQMVECAKEEILIIFSTNNAFHRQERIGIFRYLDEAVSRGVKVRILTPFDDPIKALAVHSDQRIGQKETIPANENTQIEIKPIEQSLQTRVSILIVDKKYSLVVELKDDSQETSASAIGLATYSNSKPTVLSYISTFESLWRLSELYEKLKLQDKMQREFINVAAHELRTPIQPILGLSQVLELDINNKERTQMVETISRNAKRLLRLSEDLLDVARIDSQSLQLRKEEFNIGDTISRIVADFGTQANGGVKILCNNAQNLLVEGDKDRISQVIHNLINNAIKFTSEGTIIVTSEMSDGHVLVNIKDTGTGIDAEVLPSLFTKFVTKSDRGTGLGLYISKSIIEAHGGKIWAENNLDGRGASFTFTIPNTQKERSG